MNKQLKFYSDVVLRSQRQFNDFAIGVLLASSRFSSLSKIAKLTHFSERRISQAAERLRKARVLKKINNIIILDGVHNNKIIIEKFRSDLLRRHGVRTPRPVYFRRQWWAALYWTNSYRIVSDRLQDGNLTRTVSSKFFLAPLTFSDNRALWVFRHASGFNEYLSRYGFKNM